MHLLLPICLLSSILILFYIKDNPHMIMWFYISILISFIITLACSFNIKGWMLYPLVSSFISLSFLLLFILYYSNMLFFILNIITFIIIIVMSIKMFYLKDNYHSIRNSEKSCLLCMQVNYPSHFHSIIYNKCIPINSTKIFVCIMILTLTEMLINFFIYKFSVELVSSALVICVSIIIDLIRCFSYLYLLVFKNKVVL